MADRPLPEVAVSQSDRPTSDSPLLTGLTDLTDPIAGLEPDLEVVSWLVCSPELGSEVTGYLGDALQAWALAGRGYPQMALPEAGPDCDHLQTLRIIVERIPRRIVDADGVADKMDLGRLGRLLSRALRAAEDRQWVRESVDRELRVAMQHLALPSAPYRLPGGGVL